MKEFVELFTGLMRAHGCTYVDKKGADGLKMQGKNGMFTPPTYSHIYKLKTVQQSNDKGTWFGWDVSRVGPIGDAGIYKIAKDFGANVSKGDVKVKHGDQESKSEAPY